MASIVVSGDTSGAITIAAPAVAGTNTLTLPASTGTLVVTGGAQTIEFADGSASAPSITNSGDTNTGMFFPAADTIAFTEGGVEAMRLDSSGNVLVGTTTALQSGSNRGNITIGGSASSVLNLGTGATTQSYLFHTQTGNELYLVNAANGPAIFYTNNTERMRIDSSGNVGIGTSSPAGRLDVTGNYARFFENASGAEVYLRGYYASIGAAIQVVNSFPLLFLTNNTERMRITSAGDVGIGISSPNAYGTGYATLQVNGANSGIIQATSTTNAITAELTTNSTAGVTGTRTNHPFVIKTNDTERMRITSGGDVCVGTTAAISTYALIHVRGDNKGIAIQDSTDNSYRAIYNQSGTLYFWNGTNEGSLSSAGAWTNASDVKLKNSIVDIKYGLNTVLNTQPRSYKMNNLEGEYIGFVAQELQTVIPEVVSGNPDKQLNVDYGSLVAVAFKAIQEQQQIINDLKARIETLEGAK